MVAPCPKTHLLFVEGIGDVNFYVSLFSERLYDSVIKEYSLEYCFDDILMHLFWSLYNPNPSSQEVQILYDKQVKQFELIFKQNI